MGLRAEPRVPLGAWPQFTELMEDVRDLFMMESSAVAAAIPRFRFPGLGDEKGENTSKSNTNDPQSRLQVGENENGGPLKEKMNVDADRSGVSPPILT